MSVGLAASVSKICREGTCQVGDVARMLSPSRAEKTPVAALWTSNTKTPCMHTALRAGFAGATDAGYGTHARVSILSNCCLIASKTFHSVCKEECVAAGSSKVAG